MPTVQAHQSPIITQQPLFITPNQAHHTTHPTQGVVNTGIPLPLVHPMADPIIYPLIHQSHRLPQTLDPLHVPKIIPNFIA